MRLKNLPAAAAAPLAGLIQGKPHQIASKSLVEADDLTLMLMAFDEGESVSEEQYPGDTLYLVLEGTADVTVEDGAVRVAEGEVLMVPAWTEHAVVAHGALKLLQLTVV